MTEFGKSLVINLLADREVLVASRSWQELSPGVRISPLYHNDAGEALAALLHYGPGARVARHRHTGFEHILILEGTQQDGHILYKCGDLVVHRPGTEHDIFSPNGCLALAIWERPVIFTPGRE